MRTRMVPYQAVIGFVLSVLFSTAAVAGDTFPWNGPAFSAPPAVVAKAASAIEVSKGFEVTVLLDERHYTIDETGRTEQRSHLVYRVDSASAVKSAASIGVQWEPWHQKQPEIRVRVITADGVEHLLDPKTLSDSPVRETAPEMYTDTRVYRGPLPAVAVGAVVEEEITVQDTAPALPGGTVQRLYIGRRVPVLQVRVVLETPASVPLRYEVHLLPKATVEKKTIDGKMRVTIDHGPLDPIEYVEPDVPSDYVVWPQVEFSTVPSWKQIARAYQEMVEPQIRVDDVRAIVRQTLAPGDSRAEKILKLTARLHTEVRYTGVEFGESKLVPQAPAEVLKRKYGDCKDKASALVAMLRAADVPAYLALLNAGEGQDVTSSLPGGNLFNHAIVFVPGTPDMWIDATDEFAVPGQLATGDQGRRALVIRDTTNGLVEIPVSKPEDNLLVEKREFYLSEFGPARIVEETELHGNIDRGYRSYYGTNRDSKKLQKDIEDYVKSAYLADELTKFEHGDGVDLSRPFLFRIEAAKAKRGMTSLRDARMAILHAGVIFRLPDYFKKSDEDLAKERANTEKPVPPRTVDHVLPTPFVTEWRYKIVPPPGFEVRALPDNRTQDLGPAKLTQTYAVANDGVVNAVVRFDTVKARYTAAEAEALRKAVAELRKSNAIIIAFDQVGYGLLSAGKTREAIAAFDSLVKLHPNEGLHRVQLANGLLEAGLGEAARAEAQEGVRLDPNSAIAHSTLGWILQHDLIGRRFKKGLNLNGAVAEYRKALEIDPDDNDTRADYAILLEHDAEGERYGDKADLKGAVEQYRELKKRKSTWGYLDNNLLFALFYSGQFKEVEELASQLDTDSTRTALLIAARAVTSGSEAALKKSLEITSDEKARMEALNTAANRLLNMRYYKPAADLLSKINTGASSLELINAVEHTQRYEELAVSDKDAAGFVRKMLIMVAGPNTPDASAKTMFVKPPEPKKKRVQKDNKKDAELEDLRLLGRGIRNLAVPDLTAEARGDVFLSNMKLTAEGDDNTGYRVLVEGLGLKGLSFYVIKQQGSYRLLPFNELASMGRVVLEKAQRGDLAAARKWLDWAREEQTITGGDDPFDGPVFPRLWRKGQNGDKDAIQRAAAAMLSGEDDVAPLIPAMLAAREQASDDMQRNAFNLALSRAYITLERWPEAREVGERLMRASADSLTAFHSFVYPCTQLKDWKAIENAANQRLARNPEDGDAVEVLSDAADRQGDLEKSLNIIRAALKVGKPRASLLNNYAWNGLFMPKLPDDAIEAAQRATRLTENKEFGVTHTLAAVYAEVGRLGEARQLLLQVMDGAGMEEPDSSVWYVFGRIAEQYGRADAALGAYRRVEKDDEGEPRPNSTYVLALRGLDRATMLAKNSGGAQAGK